jgi:hypothetical protein
MPEPKDYRDLPYVWRKGFFGMDEAALRAKLRGAELVIGDVAETVPKLASTISLPIGFISFDLDYYSSTMDAFRIFTGAPARRLPRVFCYFDDTIWPEEACYNEHIGELAAIRDFNRANNAMKIEKIHGLRLTRALREPWCEQIYVLHDFNHPTYCTYVRPDRASDRELPL